MPAEARDRRVTTPLDVAAVLSRRRASIYTDIDPSRFEFTVPAAGSTRAYRNAAGRRRALSLRPPGTETTARRGGRGREASRSVLPGWYPRTPLRDVSVLVHAIESQRRRVQLGENSEEHRTPLDQVLPDQSPSSVPGSSAGHRRDSSVVSPSSVSVKIRTPAGSKVPKIELNFAEEAESELLTPQKKLLNSIDAVEKAVREELQKLKRTPSARKAEREKRVRTLMSMR